MPDQDVFDQRQVSDKQVSILTYFFTLCSLDFLFITETWLTPGDLRLFSELVPSDCNFLNSPRSVCHGGGLASTFKQNMLSVFND